MHLIQRLRTGWSLMRIVKLVAGISLLVQGVLMHDWMPGLLGGVILYQAITNTGCCAGSSCVPQRLYKNTPYKHAIKETEYEEIA